MFNHNYILGLEAVIYILHNLTLPLALGVGLGESINETSFTKFWYGLNTNLKNLKKKLTIQK